MSKKVFKDLVSVEEAKSIVESFAVSRKVEEIKLENALGRIVARDYEAGIDVPPFDRSTMDGYAVIAEDTFEAEEDSSVKLKIVGRIGAGDFLEVELKRGEAIEISTGAPIPKGANAVVMEEYTAESDGFVRIYKSVAPGENIMFAGSDIMAGELVIREGTVLSPREIGVLSALGIAEVEVYSKPKVAVFSTGNELVKPGGKLGKGKIYDVNAYTLMNSIEEDGGEAVFLGIARDNADEIRKMIEQALDYDIILCSGGTSAGAGDMIYRILDEWEPGVLVHGIAVRPGKPTIIASLGNKPAFGLPGNPTSALMIYSIFVSPLIRRLSGLGEEKSTEIEAKLAVKVFSSSGKTEFLPVNLVSGEEGFSAYPVSGHYSGAITSLAESDGFIHIPAEKVIAEVGERFTVKLFSEEIKPADLMVIGSHCIGLDVIFRLLRKRIPDLRFKIINVGSSGGISAIKRGEADIAGIHLLDESAEYNVPYLKRYGVKNAVLVKGYLREQGIIVAKGNPLGIRSVEDIIEKKTRIVNRNRGSGTRILFDMYLKEIAEKRGEKFKELTGKIKGYTIEAKSHSSVAVAVLMGKADAGIGIRTVAEQYGLDFIPLRGEEYDFLIPKAKFSTWKIQQFMEVLTSDELSNSLPPGLKIYKRTGEIIKL
ncbi:MAG: molybdopterin biosynthesis protein [Archaeoglobus sp.]|nr:molybdopterin biosynthesis protein [Archaeoglobus sp.]